MASPVVSQVKDDLEFPSNRNVCMTRMNQLLMTLRLVVRDTFRIHKFIVCNTMFFFIHTKTNILKS